jgi:hypothetical protein
VCWKVLKDRSATVEQRQTRATALSLLGQVFMKHGQTHEAGLAEFQKQVLTQHLWRTHFFIDYRCRPEVWLLHRCSCTQMEVPFAAAAAAGQSEEEQLKVRGRACVVCIRW